MAAKPFLLDIKKMFKTVHGVTHTGGHAHNQDTFDIQMLDSHSLIAAVYDGHGQKGEVFADYAKVRMPALLRSAEKGNPRQALNNAFINTHEEMKKKFEDEGNAFPVELAGTTASLVWVHHDKIYMANVGDSTVVKVTCTDQEWKGEKISIDHRPEIQEERDRIEAEGGRVEQRRVGPEAKPTGPMRLYMKTLNLPGLMVSRSLGDLVAHSCGGSAVPYILDITPTAEDRFLIVASDGLWDTIQPQPAADLISKAKKPDDAVKLLMDHAFAKGCSDNITVIVLFLFEQSGKGCAVM